MTLLQLLISLYTLLTQVRSRAMWSSERASWDDLIQEAYLIGNGRLGAMPFGPPGKVSLVLNIDSLWSGGLFENSVAACCLMKLDFLSGIPVMQLRASFISRPELLRTSYMRNEEREDYRLSQFVIDHDLYDDVCKLAGQQTSKTIRNH
ncbi:hypothetical protein BDZ45DRAFT_755719 [Acephala macrosclerotiorum]|nr:hypothetical protein BDZ45DRAFT_755719 [Acephala macrosclerotiorum]